MDRHRSACNSLKTGKKNVAVNADFKKSEKVFVQWTGSVNGNRGPVTRFNYRTGSLSVGFESWAQYFTFNERTQRFDISDAQAGIVFQVQAVFSNGSVGPWITAVPQL